MLVPGQVLALFGVLCSLGNLASSHPDSFPGLRLAEQLGRREDEAKIRHGLGLSLWASGNLEEAQHQVLWTALCWGLVCSEPFGSLFSPGREADGWSMLS